MLAVSTAWNAARHAGWAPAVRELTGLGLRALALDGAALHPDGAAAAAAVRAGKGEIVALFAPEPARPQGSTLPPPGLGDPDAGRRAAAVDAARAAGRAALAAGTRVVVLRPAPIPVVDAEREDRWTSTLAREGRTDALAAEVDAARRDLARDRTRFLDGLCRSLWELARGAPDVVWCLETPAVVAGLPEPAEIPAVLSELRGRRVAYWHDAAHAARLAALGAIDARAWLHEAGAAAAGITLSDWSLNPLGSGAAAGGRSPPGTGLVDWTALREQAPAAALRVLRLPPDVPAGFVAEAVRDAASRA